jgi:hypothetical protein
MFNNHVGPHIRGRHFRVSELRCFVTVVVAAFFMFSTKLTLWAQFSSAAPSISSAPFEAVSSEDFLKQWNQSELQAKSTVHPFPRGPLATANPPRSGTDPQLVQAAFESNPVTPNSSGAPIVATAQFEAAPSLPAIGSGIANPIQNINGVPDSVPSGGLPSEAMPSGGVDVPANDRKAFPWFDWLHWNSNQPNFLAGAEVLSLRRSNDSGGSVSTGAGFDRFGRELAGRYTLAKLNGTVDRTEWVFTGPFEWERTTTIAGPVSTTLQTGSLPSSALGALQNSQLQLQDQSTSLSSFEWNHRWTGDGLSSFMSGFRLFDHDERYRLQGTQSVSSGEFRTSTDNVLAGMQIGVQLVRPLSQRLTVGTATNLGLYGNFAKGTYSLSNDGSLIGSGRDDAFRITWAAQPNVSAQYRLTQNSAIYCGYEALYFRGLATVADLRLGNVVASEPFSLRARDDQLFYGWTVGLSAKF